MDSSTSVSLEQVSSNLITVLSVLDKLARKQQKEITWESFSSLLSNDLSANTAQVLLRRAGMIGLISGYRETEAGFMFGDLSEAGTQRLTGGSGLFIWKTLPLLFIIAAVILLNTLGL